MQTSRRIQVYIKKQASSTEHNVKVLPEYFHDLITGKKTFEVRKNDRNYKVGDTLFLREYTVDENKFTGNVISFQIKYVLTDFHFGLKRGYCVLGLDELTIQQNENRSN